MSLETLRDQLQNWTLDSDEKLFTAIKNFSQTIFQTQKNIQNAIRSTKYSLRETDITMGNEFNHYLRISQSKFTQNKIGQKVSRQAESNVQQKPSKEPKPKLQIFKQAIALGMKNLEIGEEDPQKDNISMGSVAMSEYSLQQAVFKNNRLPALYGSDKFKDKFLNLVEDGDEERFSVRTKKSVVPKSPQTGKSNIQSSQEINLAPPPSLDSVLSNNSNPINVNNSNSLPPPPPLTLAPPTITSAILDLVLPPPPPPPSLSNPPVFSSSSQSQEEPKQQMSSPVKKTLSMQQELALRLQHGKNYKPPVQQKAPLVEEQRQSIRASVSQNTIDQLLKSSTNPFQKQSNNQLFEGEQEQEDSIFGKSKTRIKEKILNNPVIKVQEKTQSTNSELMLKPTFNEDILIKKKPIEPIKTQVKVQNNDKKKDIFGQDEEEQRVTFARKAPKVVENNKPVKKQSKNVFLNEEQEEDSYFTKKKPDPFQKKPTQQVQKPNPLEIKPNPISPIKPNPLIQQKKKEEVSKKDIVQSKPQEVIISPKKDEIKMIKVLPMPQKKVEPIPQQKQPLPEMVQPQKIKQKQPIPIQPINNVVQAVSPVSSKKKASQEQDEPPLPAIPSIKPNKKQSKKNSIFDDQQDDSFMFKKKNPEPKKAIAPKTEQIKVPSMKRINQSIAQENQKITNVKKNIQVKQQIKEVQEDNTDSFLEVRRPKHRPRQVVESFSEASSEIISFPPPEKKQQKKIEQVRQEPKKAQVKIQQKPMHQEVQNKPKRIPGLGMGMGMGLPGLAGLPGLNSGIGFTKPTEARKMEQEAIQKNKQQAEKKKLQEAEILKQKNQEQERKRQEQALKAKQLEIEKQELQKLQLQQNFRIQEQERAKRQRQEQIQRQNYQNQQIKRQEQQRYNRQQQQRYQRQQRQRQNRQQQQRQNKQQQERLKKQEEQRIRLEYAQRMRYQSEQRMRLEAQQQLRKAEQQKKIQKRLKFEQQQRNLLKIETQRQQRIQQEKRKLQQQVKPLPKLGPLKTEPVNQGFVPKLPSKNPFGAVPSTNVSPSLPTVPKVQAKPVISVNSKKTGGLFQEQDDDSFKPIQKKSKPANKKKLFEDDEDDGFQIKSKAPKQKNEDISDIGAKKKKNLFEDDEEVPFPKKQKKIQAPILVNEEPKPSLKPQTKKSNNIFNENDQQDEIKQIPARNPPKPAQNKNLFNDEEDEQPFAIKAKPKVAPVQQPKKIQRNQDEDDEPFAIKAKPKVTPVQQPKKIVVNEDEEEFTIKPRANQGKAVASKKKKNLFDDSD